LQTSLTVAARRRLDSSISLYRGWRDRTSRRGPAAELYRSKTVTIYVGFGPGGGYDACAQFLAPHTRRHIPCEPAVIVKHMPGAGSLALMNYLWSVAPRDRTAFGIPAGSADLFTSGAVGVTTGISTEIRVTKRLRSPDGGCGRLEAEDAPSLRRIPSPSIQASHIGAMCASISL
jgi:hypothetical protein